MASWLVPLPPDREVWVQPLARDITLCSLARQRFTLTVPLSTQVYKWVPTNLMLGVTGGNGPASYPGGSRNTPSRVILQKPG